MPPSFKNPLLEHRRAVIAALQRPGEDVELLIDELRLLLANLDIETAEVLIQKKGSPDPARMLGAGKVAELKRLATISKADLVVFNNMLRPVQLSNLRKETDCEVWDRALVIMKIFEQRATTAEAKLQVELARCRYEIPHLRGLGKQMSNAGAGIGTRGSGETEFERHRRKLQSRVVEIRRKLAEIQKRRKNQRKQRKKNGLPVIAIVGYTNSGKTTLLRYLSGDTKLYAADQLFATLDTVVRSIRMPTGEKFLMADTVGFIRELPPELMAAFRATLEEVCQADMLLVVLDLNDPDLPETYNVIQDQLLEIGAASLPRVVALNKIDTAGTFKLERMKDHLSREGFPVCGISAITGEGIEELLSICHWVLRGSDSAKKE